MPIAGDWDGNGTTTVGLYDSSTGTFWIKNSNTAAAAVTTVHFGPTGAGLEVVVGDWTGSGHDGIGVYDPAAGKLYESNSALTPSLSATVDFGPNSPLWPVAYASVGTDPASDVSIIAGHWSGGTIDTPGLYDSVTGTYYLESTPASTTVDLVFAAGPAGAGTTPLAGDWTGSGTTGVAWYDPASGITSLKNALAAGPADASFEVVPSAPITVPVAGQTPSVATGAVTTPSSTVITQSDVNQLLQRPAAASSRNDAIIAVVDRGVNILGVRVESGVPISDINTLVFAIDGAVSLARTGAFFSNNTAPLTSRTIRFISQSTITQREVQSDPTSTDPTAQGPGLVAPIGLGGEFPAGIQNTPQVDLFGIELSNRDTTPAGTDRFNVDPALVPAGQQTNAPLSYGVVSGLMPTAQSRGIATLPGGIPLYKNGVLVGGIGVFFPGSYGFASYEQGFYQIPPSTNTKAVAAAEAQREKNEINAPLVNLAEWMAFAAAGGTRVAATSAFKPYLFPVGNLAGVAPVAGYGLPLGQINLAGITLDIFGAGGTYLGTMALRKEASIAGVGNPNSSLSLGGFNPGNPAALDSPSSYGTGQSVPDGWLVLPNGPNAAQVTQIIDQGIVQATQTRAQIRLPIGNTAAMVFAVSDLQGDLLGLYRMPDATFFSIDVAVAKARNDAYYDDPTQIVPSDEVQVSTTAKGPTMPGVGIAMTSRDFRYLAEPRYPIGTTGTPPGPFSPLNDPGINPLTGDNTGLSLPISFYTSNTTSVMGYVAFTNRNFRDPNNLDNQNGVVFFPGSSALYMGGTLMVGLGVSGDGVNQDDVVTAFAAAGFVPPTSKHADQYFVRGVRLPYQDYSRNAQGL